MTKIINIDSLVKEPLVIIEVAGVRHAMKAATVGTFMENMKAIEELGIKASPVQEMEVIVGIVARAFPTLTREEINLWPLETVQKLSEIARGMNGEIVTDDKQIASESEASGNVQAAS